MVNFTRVRTCCHPCFPAAPGLMCRQLIRLSYIILSMCECPEINNCGRYLHISCHGLTENVAVEERKLEDPGNEASQQECDQSAPVEELEEKSERNEHEKNGHDAKENDLEHRLCRLAE